MTIKKLIMRLWECQGMYMECLDCHSEVQVGKCRMGHWVVYDKIMQKFLDDHCDTDIERIRVRFR